MNKGDEIYGILDTTKLFEYKIDVGDFVEEQIWRNCFKIKRPGKNNLLLNVEQYWMITRAIPNKFIVSDIIEINGKVSYICIPLILNAIDIMIATEL